MINWRVTFHSFFQRNTLETSVLVDNEWFINFSDFIKNCFGQYFFKMLMVKTYYILNHIL